MSKQLWTITLVSLLTLVSTACSPLGSGEKALRYPAADRSAVVDTYFGEDVADPYRWLEDLDGEQTRAWVEAQNAVSVPYLEAIPARETIKTRLTDLWNYERFDVPWKEAGRYFYGRNDGLQDQDVLFVADSLDGEPRVLIDPNSFSDDATIALASWSVSPDGNWVAYSTSDGGTDWKTWHIRNVESGKDLDDAVGRCKFTGASWANDSSGFYYSSYPAVDNGAGDGSKPVSIYFHRRGTAQDDDTLVYAIPDNTSKNPYGEVTEDGRFLVISIWSGYESNDVHVLKLGSHEAMPRPIFDQWDARYGFIGNIGASAFFQTNKDAPRGRVIAVDLESPRAATPSEIVAETEETLDGVSLVGGRLVCQYLHDAHSQVKIFTADGSPSGEVELPGLGSAGGFAGHADDPETFYSYTDFMTPTAIYRYSVESGESTLFAAADTGIDPAEYETKQAFFRSKDGTRVPMFITHRKGIVLDGSNPTLLYGYGGFNISMTPAYRTSRMAWVELGGVLAIANLRGGGEYGEEWHEAGTKVKKQNVFDDFIAAAEWLIDSGYTSTPKLAVQGGSNGGLLVGAVITQRPELFGAALPAVGVLDMLRYHLPSANARQWSTDLGLSENEDEYRALRAYSPYHNVQEGVAYPPTLITTADHDDRVVPWHSYKFGAALQHAQDSTNPILVRVETRAGHGAGKPTWMQIEEVADEWAFLVKQLDMDI